MKIEVVSFTVDQLKLIGAVYFPEVSSSSYPAVCLCHGIPATPQPADNRGYPSLAERFCATGFVTLIFNFRGTGKSEGNLDILGWSRDLIAALDTLCSFKEVNKEDISVVGFSAGAAVAIYVAARDSRISRVVAGACPADYSFLLQSQPVSELIECFRRIGVIRDKDFPPSLPEWLKGFEEVSPQRWVSSLSPRPILFIHGKDDDVVPVAHVLRLYEQAGAPKEIVVIPGLKHRLRLEDKVINTALGWLSTRSPSFPDTFADRD